MELIAEMKIEQHIHFQAEMEKKKSWDTNKKAQTLCR